MLEAWSRVAASGGAARARVKADRPLLSLAAGLRQAAYFSFLPLRWGYKRYEPAQVRSRL